MPYSLITLLIEFERNRSSGSRDTWFQKSSEFLRIFLLRNTHLSVLKQPSPTSNSAKFAPSIMLYNAHSVLKFTWISIKIERVIHDI